MLSNSKRSTNQLQQQQIWSICFTVFLILTWKLSTAFFVLELFTSEGNIKYASFLRRKSSFKITGLTINRSSNIRFAGVDRRWRPWHLQGRIVGIRIFRRGSKMFLFDHCSCLRAKDLNVQGHENVYDHNKGEVSCPLKQSG